MDIEEKYEKGIELINSKFTMLDIFEKIKKFCLTYIDEQDEQLCNKCQDYTLGIVDSKISEIEFTFGEPWELYEIRLNPLHFEINKQQGHSRFSRNIVEIETFKLQL